MISKNWMIVPLMFLFLLSTVSAEYCDRPFPSSYLPSSTNTNEVCIKTCVNGFIEESDCKNNECSDCSGLCTSDFKCISPGGGNVKNTPINNNFNNNTPNYFIPSIIIAMAIIIAGIIIAWIINRNKKKR